MFCPMDRRAARRSSPSITSVPPGNGHGFTLIEILVVLIVVGILAAIAIVQFGRARERAYIGAMMADLHNAAVYEELYATDNGGAYFSGTATSASPLQNFRASKDVTVTLTAGVALTPGSSGPTWIGVATHAGTGRTCERRTSVVTCTGGP